MINDRNIAWARRHVDIPVQPMQGYNGVVGPLTFLGEGVGVPVTQAINSLAVTGLLMDNAGPAVDAHHLMVPVPYDVDPDYPMGFKVNWCSESVTAADIVGFTIKCDFKALGTAVALATTALDTAIATSNPTATAYAHQWTARGVKDASFLTHAQVDAGSEMMLELTLSTMTDIDEDIFPLFVRYDYVINATTEGAREE